MQLCNFFVPGTGQRLGVKAGDTVYDLTGAGRPELGTVDGLLAASATRPIAALLEGLDYGHLPAYAYAELERAPTADATHLLAPIGRQEVWAAGVTYAWSREARVREAVAKDIYVRVYDAERPELFFKSVPEKVVGPHDWIGLRHDSRWNVPEPELALVLNPKLEIVGYTIGNDVSSRDIEGENPLYLPQAKIFRHSCALGPLVTVADAGFDGEQTTIRVEIRRGDRVVFTGETSTTQMQRRFSDLAAYLGRDNDFPYGAILLTGTGIVPPDDFTLEHGDDVAITVDGIGTLHNRVRQM